MVEQAQALTEQYPEAFIVWNILGASTSQIGMLDKAIEAYKKASHLNLIMLKPTATWALLSKIKVSWTRQ